MISMPGWTSDAGQGRRRVGRQAGTIGEWLVADLEAFSELPAVGLEHARSGLPVSRRRRWLSRQRLLGSKPWLPGTTAKRFVDQVVILCGSEAIARHQRSDGPGAFVFDPLHYLSLIETKPNALDRAAPLKGTAMCPGAALPDLLLCDHCGLDNCLAGCLRSSAGSVARFF